MTITKAELATLLHENLGVNKREATEIIMTFFEEISLALERSENVKLSGFGVFCLRSKNSRPGRNPKTGEMIPVSARRVVMYHPSHILKDRVRQQTHPDALRPEDQVQDRRVAREHPEEEFSISG
jgi:integration host factor subunit alpha